MNLKELTSALRMLRGLNRARSFGTRPNPGRTNPPYVPGTIGVSAVSEAIIRDYGRFVPRRVRRKIAKISGVPLKIYYNGPVIRG
jgi:hypothetical protein